MKSLVFLFTVLSVFAAEKFKTISIDDLDSLIAHKKPVTVLDANVESTRAHAGIIPGAVLLESSSDYDLGKLPSDKASKLVFYCANTMCSASHEAAERAIIAGYKDVSVMKDGIYGWKKAGKRLAPAVQKVVPKDAEGMIRKNEAVIVDVREGEERHEIIAGEKWFPMSKAKDAKAWSEFKSELPKGKVVIFHCAKGYRAQRAAEKLEREGLMTMYFEGPDQWKAAGLPVAKGPAPDTVFNN